jgi:hypothetical protein
MCEILSFTGARRRPAPKRKKPRRIEQELDQRIARLKGLDAEAIALVSAYAQRVIHSREYRQMMTNHIQDLLIPPEIN